MTKRFRRNAGHRGINRAHDDNPLAGVAPGELCAYRLSSSVSVSRWNSDQDGANCSELPTEKRTHADLIRKKLTDKRCHRGDTGSRTTPAGR